LGSSWGHGHVRVTFRSQDEDRPWQVEGSAAWIPLRPLTLAADARRARYGNSRSGERLHLAAGLALPLGLTARGDIAWANDLKPPYHARVSATFYSKFWRVYKSGIFALRGEIAMESWSRGTAGLDTSGNVLALSGATFMEANVEVRIAGVTIFWIQRNMNGM